MKQKNKKHYSPRLVNAVKQVSAYARDYRSYWYVFSIVDFYMMMYRLKFKADKYDVLNALCPGTQNKIITFARGDIRHRKRNSDIISLILMAVAILLMLISLRLIQDC